MAAILTPQLIEQARELRAHGVGWHTCTKRLGVSEYRLRAELEPHFQAHRREQHRRYVIEKKEIAQHKAQERERKRATAPHIVSALDNVPDSVLHEREQRKIALERRTLSQTLMGDPPEGWRALDQRARR